MQKQAVSAPQGRVEYIDLFRGLGILLMILGHLDLGNVFLHYIHAFHMPMFFFVSGLFFKPARNMPDFIRKKARSLLLPYAVFGIGHYLMYLVAGGRSLNPLKQLLFVNTIGLPITGALWFLTALFITELIYHLLDKYLSNRKLMHLAVIVIALAGNMMTRILPFRLPYAMDAGFVGVGLYHLGRLFKDGLEKEKSLAKRVCDGNIPACIIALIIGGALIFFSRPIDMRAGNYGIVPMFWINALLTTIALMILCRRLYRGQKTLYPLLRLGRNSIVFLCTNEFFLYSWEKVLRRLADLPVVAEKIIVFVVAMICMFIVERILTGTRLRILIGRK